MAQYVPAPALSSPAGLAVQHNPDDADVQTRLPSICVDYLSHDWAEEDVWASWRSMTRKKNEIANGVRLENASWRTWWKQRNKLKTISPETLNWLKDSDVTWLYGPLHTAVEAVPPPKIATTEDKLDLHSGKKPILKHRTLSEILTSQRPASPVLESLDLTSEDEGDDHDGTGSVSSSYDGGRPHIPHTKSDTNIVRRGSTRRPSPPRVPIPTLALVGQGQVEHGIAHGHSGDNLEADGNASNDGGSASPGGQQLPAEKRHISFNTFVEQCISLDEPTSISPDRPQDDSSDDDDSDDDVLEMRSTSSSVSSASQRPSLSRQGSDPKEHFTIAHIAPTLLKSSEKFPAPSPGVVFMPPNASAASASSAQLQRSNSHGSASSSSSDSDNELIVNKRLHAVRHGAGSEYDFPSPIDQAEWDEDDDEFRNLVKGSASSSSSSGRNQHAAGRVGHVNHYESSPNTSPNNSRLDLPSATNGQQQQKPPRRGASIGSSATPPTSGSSTPTGGPKADSQLPSKPPPSSTVPTSSSAAGEGQPLSPTAKQPGRSILKNRGGGGGGVTASPATSPTHDSYFPDAQSLQGAVASAQNAAASSAAAQGNSTGAGVAGGLLPVNAPSNQPSAATGGAGASAGSDDDEGGQRRGRSVSRNSSSSSLVERASQSRSASGGSAVPASPSINAGHGGASIYKPPQEQQQQQAPQGGRAAKPPSINTAPGGAARPSSPDAASEVSTPGEGTSRDDYWADKVPSATVLRAPSPSEGEERPSVADPDEAARIAKNDELAREVMRSFEAGPGAAGGDLPKDEKELKEEGKKKDEDAGSPETTPFEGSEGEYEPTESTNPTPHSSPLIAMRPLPNSESTSAASLPHSPGVGAGARKPSSPSGGNSEGASSASPSSAFAALGLGSPNASSSSPAVSATQAATSPNGTTGGGGVVETAKGLLGALWGMGGQSPKEEGAKRA